MMKLSSDSFVYTASRRVRLITRHPLAADSIDHLHPLGTMQDNFRSPAFTKKLLDLYSGESISVLDLGCAGGGFAKEINEAGHLGVGLEGSDYSQRHRRAEWATIPDRLFTCDCTKPFELRFDEGTESRQAFFETITAWEFLEHIKEEDLGVLFNNVAAHLNPDTGLFVASVHLHSCLVDGHEYHATVQPEWWWRDLFRKHGFFLIDRALDYFDEDWVRGPKDGQDAFGACHMVAALRHDSEIVRRIDRAACSRFEHGRLGVSELRRVAARALDKADSLIRAALQQAQDPVGFSTATLRRLTAHVVARCEAERWDKIAVFGAGSHTEMLIPLLRSMGGPSVEAVIVSQKNEDAIRGIPVLEIGDELPNGVRAILPSSHRHEADLRAAARAAYPLLPWIFLWSPEKQN